MLSNLIVKKFEDFKCYELIFSSNDDLRFY